MTPKETALAFVDAINAHFAWFPDYQIEVNEIFEGQSGFGMFGFAEWVIQRRSGSEMASACGLESYSARGSNCVMASRC